MIKCIDQIIKLFENKKDVKLYLLLLGLGLHLPHTEEAGRVQGLQPSQAKVSLVWPDGYCYNGSGPLRSADRA